MAAACTNGADQTGTDAAYARCVAMTNELRGTVGKPVVARSTALETFANTGAETDFAGAAHDHFRATNGGGISFAENECPHWDLSFGGGDEVKLVEACINAFWSEGPGGGHYDNMTGAYGTLGCGIYHEAMDYTIVQDYGQ
jgi:hypothetical protein